jgi:hypothetical protein
MTGFENIRICYRSVVRGSDSGSVRPDGTLVLLQQDFRPDSRYNFEDTTAPTRYNLSYAAKTSDTSEEKLARFMDDCVVNTNFEFDDSGPTQTWVVNNFNGLFEAYSHSSNHDLRSGYESLEDGRSRRYVVRSGKGTSCLVSHDLLLSGLPIRFGLISDVNGFCINRTTLSYFTEYNLEHHETVLTILHGQNPSWFDFKQRPGASLKCTKIQER